MNNFDATIEELTPVLKAGNVLIPLRFYLQRLRSESRVDKLCIYAKLREVVAAYGKAFSVREIEQAVTLLDSYRDNEEFERDRLYLIEGLRRLKPASTEPVIGAAKVLLVSTVPFQGEHFGAVQTLYVNTRWGGGVELKEQRQALSGGSHEAFVSGRDAAFAYIESKINTLDISIFLRGYRVEGAFTELGCPVEGNSLALASGIATLSQFLKLPVPQDIGFTGCFNRDGSIGEVSGIKAKLKAARDFGLRTVFVPKTNDGTGEPDIEVIKVGTFGEVVERIFDKARIDRGLSELRQVRAPDDMWRRTWMTQEVVNEKAPRVLLTFVGRRDPFGDIAPGDPIAVHEDGPLLAIASEIRPQKIYLFYTTNDEYGKSNNFQTRAKAVKAVLNRYDPDCDVIERPLDSVTDPTDLEQLFPALKKEFLRIVQETTGPVQFFVNVSSGTPQVLVTWLLAVERGLIPNAIRLQVRESRFVKKDESRIRRVVPPGW
ncbi:MAG: S16 family serine protease [Gammaproteobacteria bacterium]